MADEVPWIKRLQPIAKWALLAVAGLAVGLVAIFLGLAYFWTIYVIVRLLGAKLGLWEFDLGLE
jgi:hypothetical protein